MSAFAETYYFVLAAARQGQTSCYLKRQDKLRVSQSVFYLLFEGTLFKQPMVSFYFNNMAVLTTVVRENIFET